MIEVRLARENELATIQQLNSELFEHDKNWIAGIKMDWPYTEGERFFRDVIAGLKGVCFVAEIGGKVVGYLAGTISDIEGYRKMRRSELCNMYVENTQRCNGAGRKLVEAFERWSRENGVERILVVASSPNKRAISFYEQQGFQPYSLELEKDLS